MRHFILLIICYPLFNSAFAQDWIYNSDSSVLKVKILEYYAHEIWYRLFSDTDSLIHVIDKYYVSMVVFENGEHVKYNQMEKRLPSYPYIGEPVVEDLGRNFISINILDFNYSKLTVSYEYTLRPGNFRIKIPLSIGLNHSSSPVVYRFAYFARNRSQVISTGVDFYWYPPGQGRLKYFVGPSFEFGLYNFGYDLTYWKKEILTGKYYRLFILPGLLFQPFKNFNVSFFLGAGITASRAKLGDLGPHINSSHVGVILGINAGIRF